MSDIGNEPFVEPSTPAPESTADQAPVETLETPETPEAAPEKTFTQKELDDIIGKRLAKESRRAERDAQNRESRIQQEIATRLQKVQPAPVRSGEPKPAEFQDYESYIAALTDYKVDQKMTGFHQQGEAQRQQQYQREQAQFVQKRLSTAASKYEDFNEVALSEDVPISQAMAAYISESDAGGDVAYFLGKNLDEAERIHNLSPTRQVIALDKLAEKLNGSPSNTRVPAPIVPNAGKAVVSKNTFELPWKDFVAQRRKETSRR